MAELGRQSNTLSLLLGHARDEIVAATGCTPEAAENTIRKGLEEQRLGLSHGHIDGQLPAGVTDVAAHLFSRRIADEKLECDWANSSATRSGPDYSYTVRNIRVERIELMTWCRKDNLLLPEKLLAPPLTLSSPDFAKPALTQTHAESFSVGGLDFATPVLTVRPGPGQAVPPETAANPTEPAPASTTDTPVVMPAVSSNQEPMAANPTEPVADDVAVAGNPKQSPSREGKAWSILLALMRKYPEPVGLRQSYPQWLAEKQHPEDSKPISGKTFANLMPEAKREIAREHGRLTRAPSARTTNASRGKCFPK